LSLFAEFKQRRIWRVLIAYPGVVFVALQVVEFFTNNYDLDHRFLTATMITALVILPAAVLWNWRHGEQGKQQFAGPEIGAYVLTGFAMLAAVGWYWQATPSEAHPAPQGVTSVRTVAVMPFTNVGGDSEAQYLCDGIAESLINWLASVPGVKVVSKSAAFRLREHSDDTEMLVETLEIDNLVRGRLEQIGDEIVVSAALVDVHDQSQLWGERLVQPLSGIMDLEHSIVLAIKDGLRLKVSDIKPDQRSAGGTDSPEAYQHYLRGHFLIEATDSESIEQGLEELREAISIDPQFALPHADIANSMLQMVLYGMPGSESLKGEARNAAFTAVALAPDLPEAQIALATVHQTITFDWEAAEEAYEAAISLSPQNPSPYHRYADFLWGTMRFDRALDMARHGLAIDPMDGSSMHAVGISLMYSGDFAAAASAFEEWNRFYPGSRWSYVKLALAQALDGRCEAAAEQAATAERLSQGRGSLMFEAWLAWGYQVCGQDDLYARSRTRMEAYRVADPDSIDPGLAFYRIMERDLDGLVKILEETVAVKSPVTMFLQLYLLDTVEGPLAGAISADPRMRELIRSLNFPPSEWSVTEATAY